MDRKRNLHSLSANYARNIEKSAGRRSFLFALSYMEQFVNAVLNLLQLSYVGQRLNARLIVPHVRGSRLFGLPNFNPAGSGKTLCPSLSEYVDMESFSGDSEDCNIEMSPLEDFLTLSHRQIILFHPVRTEDFKKIRQSSFNSREKYYFDFLPADKKDLLFGCIQYGPCSCKDLLREATQRLQEALDQQTNDRGIENFVIIDVICFHGDRHTSLSKLLQVTGAVASKVSYVFTHWSGRKCVNSETGDSLGQAFCTQNGSGVSLALEGKEIHPTCANPVGMLARSIHPHIRALSARFLSGLGIEPHVPLTTIHIRFEKFRHQRHALLCCLKTMLSQMALLKQAHSDLQVVVFSDIGPFGTTSCGRCSQLAEDSRNLLKEHNMDLVHFEPDLYGEQNDTLLAVLSELTTVAMGNNIFLVGGGQFQETIRESSFARVQEGIPLPAVYSICSKKTIYLTDSESDEKLHSGC